MDPWSISFEFLKKTVYIIIRLLQNRVFEKEIRILKSNAKDGIQKMEQYFLTGCIF